ncbi:MAG: Fic family protein [Acidimicrobiales bacterium]|nr:Fic family protein [Acidimicrobiales bacterium]
MIRYLDLAEYLWLAEQVTGVEAATLAKASRIDLADSALHAPAAGFGDDDFYPDIYDKAAILCCRLAWNHPLPDGNKRASWASLLLFVDFNAGVWDPDPPDVDQAEEAMMAVAAGEVDEEWVANWLRERVRF